MLRIQTKEEALEMKSIHTTQNIPHVRLVKLSGFEKRGVRKGRLSDDMEGVR